MGRRVAVLLVTGLLATVLAAGSGVAQAAPAQTTTNHFDPSGFLFVFPDPCNPQEEVTVTGTATGFITEVVTPTGDYMYTLHLHQQGTALGSEGTEYSFNFTENNRFRLEDQASDATVFTATAIVLLNNLGSGPNFVVHGVFHVTGLPDNPVVVVNFGEGKCLG
jgi:hypothetical protein